MPTRARRSIARRARGRKAGGMKTLKKTVKRIARQLPEMQYYDDNQNDVGITSAMQIPNTTFGSFKALGILFGSGGPAWLGMGQGSQTGDIRGSFIRAHFLELRGEVYLNGISPDANNIVRVAVFWDNEFLTQSGTVQYPNVGNQCLTGGFNGASSLPNITSLHSSFNPQAVGRGKRFQILKEKYFVLSATGQQSNFFHWKIPLKGRKMQYQGGTNNCFQQSLSLYMNSDSVLPADPQVNVNMRLAYTSG